MKNETLVERYCRRLRSMADGEQVDYDFLLEVADELEYLARKIKTYYEIYEARG